MIKRLNILSLLLSPAFLFGQMNLVPNGDFEQITDKKFPCSWLVDAVGINEYVFDWYTPIGTTTDVMSTYADDECWAQVPNTGEGKMAPHSGNVMIGFINYSPEGGCQPNEWHEYLTVKLTQKLTPGNVYCVEYWIALGANSNFATNNIGALFTTENPERSSCKPIFQKPQINADEVVKNTKTWHRIQASFLADSAYEYLTIGNFFTHEQTIIEVQKGHPAQQPQGTPEDSGEEKAPSDDDSETYDNIDLEEENDISYLAYYFIDDVSVMLCPSVQVLPKKIEKQLKN